MQLLVKQLKNLMIISFVTFAVMFIILIPKDDTVLYNLQYNIGGVIQSVKETFMKVITGESLGNAQSGAPVWTEVNRYMIRSLKLIIPSFLISMIVGVLLGLFSFRFREKLAGKITNSTTMVASAIPDFFLFILIQYSLLVLIRMGFPKLDLFGHEYWYNLILPTVSLCLYPMIYISRISFSMLEAESIKKYVYTARAKGKSEFYILRTHLLWNIWGTVLVQSKTVMLYILTSLPIIELLAFYKGAGHHLLSAIKPPQDQMLIVGFVLPFIFIMYLVMVISDFAAYFLLPNHVDNSKAMKPLKSGRYKKYVVSIVYHLSNIFYFLFRNPLLSFSSLVLIMVISLTILGQYLPFVDKDLNTVLYIMDENNKPKVPPIPPSEDYLFGTDRHGRDLLSLLILGAKETLLIVLIVSLLRFIISIPLGFFSAKGSSIFKSILKISQILFSYFPILFLIMILMSFSELMTHERRAYWFVSFLVIVEVGRLGQIYQNEFKRISEMDYMQAGISVGTKGWSLFKGYYFPQLKHNTIIYFTTDLGRSLFLLSQLGFVSVFITQNLVQDDTGLWVLVNTSLNWPVLLSNSLQDIRGATWIPFYTSMFIAITILSFTLLGEGLRQYFHKDKIYISRKTVTSKIDRLLTLLSPVKKFKGKKVGIILSISIVLSVPLFVFLSSNDVISNKVVTTTGKEEENYDQQVQNIATFAKVFGYVRYFHPSDQVVFTDWNTFASEGVSEIKNATDEQQLMAIIEKSFSQIAPTIQFTYKDEEAKNPFIDIQQDDPNVELVAWQHRGLGKQDSPYISQRVAYKPGTVAGPLFEGLPKQEEIIVKKISENITMHLPLAIYRDEKMVLDNAEMEFFEKNLPLDDVDVRVGNIIIAWNMIKHFYPYKSEMKEPWDDVLIPALNETLKASTEQEYLDAFKKMLVATNDGNATIKILGSNEKIMLPFRATIKNGNLEIIAASPDSPFRVGDIVLKKNGKPVSNQFMAIMDLETGSDQYRMYKAINSLISEYVGEKVNFTLKRGESEIDVEMNVTEEVEVDEFNRNIAIEEMENGIYYVNLDGLKMKDLEPFMNELLQAKGVMFDLRGTPDPSTKVILSHLVKDQVIGAQYKIPHIIYPDLENLAGYDQLFTQNWTFEPKEPSFKGKVVFLAYSGTHGLAESYLSVVEENNLAEIVGDMTAGSSGDIYKAKLPGNLVFTWTSMKVEKSNKDQFHGVGVRPTIPVQSSNEQSESIQDEYVEKGIEVIKRSYR
ncbi:ABC transporter permease subunit [Bacillus sp. AK128]